MDILHNDEKDKSKLLDSRSSELLSILLLHVDVNLLQRMQDIEAIAKQKGKILVVSAVIRDPNGRFLLLKRTQNSYV